MCGLGLCQMKLLLGCQSAHKAKGRGKALAPCRAAPPTCV